MELKQQLQSLKINKESIGLAPDAIMFRGQKKSDIIRLSVIGYDAVNFTEFHAKDMQEVGEYYRKFVSVNDEPNASLAHTANSAPTAHSAETAPNASLAHTANSAPTAHSAETESSSPNTHKLWVNIDGVHDEKIMQEILTHFDLDPLIISDVMNTHSRPKIHEYDDCIYISIKMLRYDEPADLITEENVVLILKEHLLLTFQEEKGDVFEPIRERLRKGKKRIRTHSTDYLTFALLDIIIDNYIYITSLIGEAIETLDDELISTFSKHTLEEININKSLINHLRKSIKPSREMILSLVKMDSELIDEEIHIHLKELQHNINLANDMLDSSREILSDQISIFLTSVSSRLNDILKFLTIFSSIFIPLTFIAGIYGTNFVYIPLLHFKYGFFVMIVAIIAIASIMIIYFKRRKWL